MSPSFFIPFSSLNPDGALYTHPQRLNDVVMIEDYDDVIPAANNMAVPRRSLSVITTPALTGKCRGTASFTDKIGRNIVLAGDATSLYRAFSTLTGTFTFSNIGASYTLSTCAQWEFASFPSPTSEPAVHDFYATNFTNAPQRLSTRASATHTFSLMSSDYTNIRARHIGVLGQFLLLGNTADTTSASVAYTPSRMIWSAFGDPREITPSAATQSDYEDLATGGAVQKIIGGTEYAHIFQETQVMMMRYVGGDPIFDFAPIQFAPGTPIPSSVIGYGGSVYYISREGFIALEGGAIKRIGVNRVDLYFWRTVEQTRLHDISVAVDPVNKIIWWSWPESTAGFGSLMLGYAFSDGRWVRWTQNIEQLGSMRLGLPGEALIAFDTDHKLKTFTTDAFVTARLDTKAFQPVVGRRWQCNGVRLRASGVGTFTTGTCQAEVYDTTHPGSLPVATTAVSIRTNENYFPMRVAGQFIRFLVRLNPGTSTDTNYVGLEVDYQVLGTR